MIDIPPDEPPIGHSRDAKRPVERPLGAGSEAAEGIHAEGVPLPPHADTALDVRVTGVGRREGAERSGSEPLQDRSVMHTPGYGGEGGAPRTSSDQREHLDADGTLESED